MFNPSRLTLARHRRGLTKTRLADLTGLTPRSISDYETGRATPYPANQEALGKVLNFPVEFFFAQDVGEVPVDCVNFRALARMTRGQRDAALAAGAIALDFNHWIESHFKLPEPDIPDFRGFSPDEAASLLRVEWGLGERPIRSMVHLLEFRGVRVFSLAEDGAELDAFSFWRSGSVPFVFLNTQKTAEHGRFDAAHELGHLVLRHEGACGREVEREADAFAAAFLMPTGSVLASAPRFPTLGKLIQLKKKWSVSVAALVRRLKDLGLITDWQYRSLSIEIQRRGYRTSEPGGIPKETSQVLQKILAEFRQEGVTLNAIARELFLPVEELQDLVFGLTMLSVEGEASAVSGGSRPCLRLIIGGDAE